MNLSNLIKSEIVVSSYISAYIEIYPFQIASSNFAIDNFINGLRGTILCDESGLGKSHEAMLIVSQFWLMNKCKIMIVIPNIDLLSQWVSLIENYYTLPFVPITNNEEWNTYINGEWDNLFYQECIVITTQKFLYSKQDFAVAIPWDLMVFDEATTLSNAHDERANSIANILKTISKNCFKLLLTGTPIEKNIMDLYGLIYFIDRDKLPNKYDFLKRYLRKPENYRELANIVSPYCFRSTRSSIVQYANITGRKHISIEFDYCDYEKDLYDLIYKYCCMDNKVAYPEMDNYDLALKLLSIFSSSSVAIVRTFKGVLNELENLCRLEHNIDTKFTMEDIQEEILYVRNILDTAKLFIDNSLDTKTTKLISTIDTLFDNDFSPSKKALIFTENLETQKYLYDTFTNKYGVVLYNGEHDYSSISKFKHNQDINILISTDSGARGFNIQECNIVIHYDLTYNTLKMEQRIDRCHRLGQDYDVVNVCLVNRTNLSDIRKLELIKKRLLVSNGIFGISDNVIGGFTENAELIIDNLVVRNDKQVKLDYENTLKNFKQENLSIVENTEEILFTKFDQELSNKIKITPEYLEDKNEQFKLQMWEVVRIFFDKFNEKGENDCFFEVDDENKTVKATNYDKLPMLFYYHNGKKTRPYYSLASYGIEDNFKPHNRRITPTSPLIRGILDNFECSNYGSIKLEDTSIKKCKIGLYLIIDKLDKNKEYLTLVGLTSDKIKLTHNECLNILKLPMLECVEEDNRSPSWLKHSTNSVKNDDLDNYVDLHNIIKKKEAKKQDSNTEKEIFKLESELRILENEFKTSKSDKMKKLALTRKINKMKISIKSLKENNSKFDLGTSINDKNSLNDGNMELRREFLLYINY